MCVCVATRCFFAVLVTSSILITAYCTLFRCSRSTIGKGIEMEPSRDEFRSVKSFLQSYVPPLFYFVVFSHAFSRIRSPIRRIIPAGQHLCCRRK